MVILWYFDTVHAMVLNDVPFLTKLTFISNHAFSTATKHDICRKTVVPPEGMVNALTTIKIFSNGYNESFKSYKPSMFFS